AQPPGPGLPLPGLRAPAGRGASRAPLGAGRPDNALEPRPALSPPPPRGPRGGLPGRSTTRRRALVPTAGWPALARGPASGRGARRSGPGAPGAARRAGTPTPRADGVPGLAGGAPRRRLGDRRLASPGHARRGNRMIASAGNLRAWHQSTAEG